MAIKSENKIVSVKFSPLTYELIKKFSNITGYSYSRICQIIVDDHLPCEVEKYLKKMEVLNETKTKNETC